MAQDARLSRCSWVETLSVVLPPRSLAVLLSALVAAGCSAPRRAQAPADTAAEAPADSLDVTVSSGDDEASMAELDRAAATFEEAERSLDTTLEGALAADDDAGPTAGVAEEAPPKAAAPAGELSAVDRCDRSCRALDSMRRSAERLCDLTGADDPRCDDVGQRLERAQARVEATCGACG